MPWPMCAARCVARVYSIRVASSARSTRPPSIGNAGSRLNATRHTLTISRRSMNEPAETPSWLSGSSVAVATSHAKSGAGDRDVDGRPGERHPQLLPRVVGHALEARDAADRQQRDVARADAVVPGRQRVAVLVQRRRRRRAPG